MNLVVEDTPIESVSSEYRKFQLSTGLVVGNPQLMKKMKMSNEVETVFRWIKLTNIYPDAVIFIQIHFWRKGVDVEKKIPEMKFT